MDWSPFIASAQERKRDRAHVKVTAASAAAAWFPCVPAYEPPTNLASFNRRSWQLDTARAALLIHDMQRFWVERCANPTPLIERIARMATVARGAGVPIIYSGSLPATAAERGLNLERWGPGIAEAGEGGSEIVPELAPSTGDFMVHKSRYSAFYRTGLEQRLRALGRDQLIITGLYAHHGCLATALDAYMRDLRVFFVADAMLDHSYDVHVAALRYVGEVCGHIVSADEIQAIIETRHAP